MNSPLNALLETAIGAARAAGDHALANRHRRRDSLRTPAHDVKLVLDVECQRVATDFIRARFPEQEVLGEEDDPSRDGGNGQPQGGEAPLQWVIDPIDGTVNFSHGYPLWCCSVAVRRAEEVLAGAVYAPEIEKLFSASIDSVAECNGSPIHVSEVDAVDRAMVFTGTNRVVPDGWAPGSLFGRLAESVQRPRIDGAAALDICHVAEGLGDGYLESGIYIWDVAAAGLIVRRAGGMAETLLHLKGGALIFLASNGRIHNALRAISSSSSINRMLSVPAGAEP